MLFSTGTQSLIKHGQSSPLSKLCSCPQFHPTWGCRDVAPAAAGRQMASVLSGQPADGKEAQRPPENSTAVSQSQQVRELLDALPLFYLQPFLLYLFPTWDIYFMTSVCFSPPQHLSLQYLRPFLHLILCYNLVVFCQCSRQLKMTLVHHKY